MSDRENPANNGSALPPLPRRGARRRLRRFFLRHLPLAVAGAVVLLALAVTGLYFAASSARFENLVRKRLAASIEDLTGGRVEIASFRWHLLHLEAEAGGVTIHGLEDPGEAPLATIETLRVVLSLRNLFSPTVRLRSLEIGRPCLHLIVYPNGTTNLPAPKQRKTSSRPSIDTLFALHASRIAIEEGRIHYDVRAAEFDYQDRYLPFDFAADDLSLAMRHVAGPWRMPASYRIEVGVTDLDLARSVPRKSLAVHGAMQATLDLERSRVVLRSLRLAAARRGSATHALNVTGGIEDFAHPRWHARLLGDLDLRLIEPATGYADAPAGLAHLDLTASGEGSAFTIDGGVHIDDCSYIGEGIHARDIALATHVHADQKQLLIPQISARLRQGGQIDGSLAISPWLPLDPSAHPQKSPAQTPSTDRNALVRAPDWMIPVNGKVTADFKNVALDSLLDMVSPRAYRRLGLDTRLNGSAAAAWSHGDGRTVVVDAQLALSPSRQTPAGEVPASGAIEASYAHRNGAVQLRRLELHTPASDLEAHGALGAYPVDGPSALTLDVHSRNLAEFDPALRSLGFQRNGKIGIAALPVALAGRADFHGAWTGSLARPQIAGILAATQLSVALPSTAATSAPLRQLRFDSVSAEGIYSPARITIRHAQLLHGGTRITIEGALDAAPNRSPEFGANSLLHARFDGTNLDAAEVEPFLAARVGEPLQLSGLFNAQINADGSLQAPFVSGSLAMAHGVLNGEPVSGLHLRGAFDGQRLKLSPAALKVAGGELAASGSYDFKTRQFQIAAHAEKIELAQMGFACMRGLEAAGKLAFTLTGSGTLSNPHLDGQGAITEPTFRGEPFGTLHLTAHAAGPTLQYSASTQRQRAVLALRGETLLRGDDPTRAQLAFSRFDLGAVLRMAHVDAFNGQSALDGTIAIDGPLAHPSQLRGEAQLRDLALTLSGVALRGEGGLHATLAHGRIHLDPLHVTGENTDLRMEGALSIEGERRLDLAAQGAINLKLAETLDPDLTASGTTVFQVEAHGPLDRPTLQGRIECANGALSLGDLPNGLSQLHGTLVFNQNRLEVQSLTAMSGGGLLSVGGFLSYRQGIFADLSVTGKDVHIRYPDGVSSLADATLHLRGPQNNLLLSGDVLITRFSVSPDLDLASLVNQASAATQAVAPPDAPSNHLRLDVRIASSPQLNFQNAFAKLGGNVDLHLRGTLAAPSLLGRVSIVEGSALIAGTRYDLERGDVTFTNPVRIEPVVDLSATARVEDYDIALGLHGSPQKLSISYRSDPPLPEADVVSLLALGHTASQQRLYTQQQQEQTLANPTDAILGGALNATVSSRIQKLFGAGSVKVDPNYLGAFGYSTSRITVQEQIGRIVTLTFATDVDTASEQLLQAEVAINRHLSLVVARDESGVFSMVIKNTRRYR